MAPKKTLKIQQYIVRWLMREKSKAQKPPLCDFDRICHELKPADVILLEGHSRVSNVIKLITQSPWSHAALYIGRIHDIENPDLRNYIAKYHKSWEGNHLIIESQLGKGTIIRNLQDYQHMHVRICRPANLHHKDAQKIIEYASKQVGREYDVRQIFDLARFFFPWFIMPRRWRSTLFKTNAGAYSKTVCSTMIAEAFGSIDFPILPLVKIEENKDIKFFRRNPKLCTPSDFDYSPYFKIIKYPFLDFNHQGAYHLLPWTQHGHLDNKEKEFYINSNEPIDN